MKKLILASALALAASAAYAGIDSVFYADQGKVVIPSLKMGSQTYYVMLRRQGTTFNFSLDSNSVTLLTPPLGYTPPSASEIVGSWSPDFDTGSTVTFNANGTYSMVQSAGSDSSCPNGGPESGTYQYDATTGVFVNVATSDSNGECGLSHPDGAGRLKKVGTDIYLFFKDGGTIVESKLTKKP